jgi:hypothetical protein
MTPEGQGAGQPRGYLAYLLRLWRDMGGETTNWVSLTWTSWSPFYESAPAWPRRKRLWSNVNARPKQGPHSRKEDQNEF